MILDETGWKWYHHVLLSIMSMSKWSICYFPIISKLYSNLCDSEATSVTLRELSVFDFTKVLATTAAALLRAWCCGFNLTHFLSKILGGIRCIMYYHVISNKQTMDTIVLYILCSKSSLFIHCWKPLRVPATKRPVEPARPEVAVPGVLEPLACEPCRPLTGGAPYRHRLHVESVLLMWATLGCWISESSCITDWSTY